LPAAKLDGRPALFVNNAGYTTTQQQPMKILLTNDDGIHAPGLEALYHQLKGIAQVKVVAPEVEQSAVGHAITIYNPLRVTEILRQGDLFGYAVNGTPADCVKLGANVIFSQPPDLVVSGINLGMNAGDCIIYSGTVSAATEAIILGIPAIAVSLNSYSPQADFSYAARFVSQLVQQVHQNSLPPGTLLNVNIPAVSPKKIKGVQITRQGRFTFKDVFVKRLDPKGRTYYWLENEDIQIEPDGNYDLNALKQNKISITPIKYDFTNYEYLAELEKWNIPC
jgi:5'-nucleotidase